ncbi:helix-turn-helix domain-containing protein [Streptomyces abikoensis]|uniref:Helix-turn-helix domain-containing protein n=1 Tax=Streptomyces abikoensis TaxID=97398 RepID=A0ABW7TCE7_9ACTN
MERPPTFQVSGAALRRTRMRQGLGLKETADAAGISRSYLQRLETGIRQHMRPGTYVALRIALRVNDDRLLATGEEDTEEMTWPSAPTPNTTTS